MIYHGGNEGVYNLDGLEDTVRKTTKNLRQHLDEFDSIAVSGMSGAVVGVPVALRLKKPIAIVRRENDGSHQGGVAGGVIGKNNLVGRVLFLDDFVSMGRTRGRVIKAASGVGANVVAQYLYSPHIYRREEDGKWRD